MKREQEERGAQIGLETPRPPGQPAMEAMVRNANTVPVMVALETHCPIFLFSRVPVVGERIALDLGDVDGGTRWRVVSVQHIPHPNEARDVVAEIHCVADPDFDAWDGQHSSQRSGR